MNINTALKVIKKVRTRKLPYVNVSENNGVYTIRGPEILSRTVTYKGNFSQFRLPETLPAGIVSIEGRQTLNTLPIARLTRSHGYVGTSSGQVNHWYVHTPYGHAIIHRSGTIQISSNTIGKVTRIIEKLIPITGNAKISKIDARLFINRVLSLDDVSPYFKRTIPASLGTWFYNPDLRNRAEVKWNQPSMTLIFYMSGQVQIFGASKPSQAVDVVKTIVSRVGMRNIFKYSRNSGGFAAAPTRALTKNEKLKEQRLAKLNARHPRVESYNVVPPAGKYVRPGPNKQPRLYNIKSNMGLVTAKIIKAYNNAGVNMPSYVSNLVLENPPFMMSAPGAQRAKNYGNKKNGFYVRPGPGHLPHFYKVPKNLKAGFKTAQKAYNRAGINMPSHVRNIFGIVNNNNNGVRNANHLVNGNKINGRQYKRFTTAQLVAIARNLGNAGASNGMTKNALFERIKRVAPTKTPSPVRSPNVTVNGRVYIFTNDPTNQRIVRNGRKRVFSTLPKAEREAIARAYLGNNYSTVPAKNWYNAMRAKKRY